MRPLHHRYDAGLSPAIRRHTCPSTRPSYRPRPRAMHGTVRRIIILGKKGYEAEAKSLFARMTVEPTGSRKALINTLIKALKTLGIWTLLDTFWILAAHDAQAGRLNWIADTYNFVGVNSPTFVTDRGYRGDGSSSYLETGFAPSMGVNYAQQTNHLSGYVNAAGSAGDGGVNGVYIIGVAITTPSSSGSLLGTRATTNALRCRSNAPTTIDIGAGLITSRNGMSMLNRKSNTNLVGYKDGVNIGFNAATTQARVVNTMGICCAKVGGVGSSFTTETIAQISIGGTMTDAQVAGYYGAVHAYMTAIGAQA